jgi:hypothetical protein
MTQTATGTFDQTIEHEAPKGGHGCVRKEKKPWSALELGVMIGGFIIFWPLGLVALFLKLKNGEMWNGASDPAPWSHWKKPDFSGLGLKSGPFASPSHSATGNEAFDTYKREALARLEEERRKLDEEQRAFGEYLAKLRKAKDQDEFDRFMAERVARSNSPAA